jgi:hypothetical protein
VLGDSPANAGLICLVWSTELNLNYCFYHFLKNETQIFEVGLLQRDCEQIVMRKYEIDMSFHELFNCLLMST